MAKRVSKAWSRRGKEWSPGDIDFTVRLKRQTGGSGKPASGAWVYLTGEHIAAAVLGSGGRFETVNPDDYVARRTILDPGTGQVLIRLRKAK